MTNAFLIRIFFLAVGLAGGKIAHAQNGDGASLVGTWELRAIEMRGKFSTPDYLQWNVLSSDGALKRYTIEQPEPADRDTIEESGKWNREGEDLVLWFYSNETGADSTCGEQFEWYIQSVSDSSLVLSGRSGKMFVKHYWHRTTLLSEARRPKPSFVAVFGNPEEMELRWFCLVRVDKPAKRVRLSPYRSCELIRSESDSDTIDTLWHTRSGIVHRAGTDGFQFRVRSESLTLDYREKSILTVDREYFEGQDTVVYLPYGYPAFAIRYQSPARKSFSTIGTTLIVTGALTALIAAPLSAIDYGGGSFRTERYRNVALGGLAAVTVGIPVSILSRPKKYPIYTPEATHCESWKIIACE
jgi:hypothetical protein